MSRSTAELRKLWTPACQFEKRTLTMHSGASLSGLNAKVFEAFQALDAVMRSFRYVPRANGPGAWETGAYNCRKITGGSNWSLHAYGIAVDINARTKPYGKKLITDMPFAMVAAIKAIETRDGVGVFRWGGDYRTNKDAMHYEVVASPKELSSGVDWNTVSMEPPNPADPRTWPTLRKGDRGPRCQITARLVTVVVIAYLISVLIPADDPIIVQSLAFLAGVVPNTVLRRLGELTGGKPLVSSLFGQAFGEDRPLTLIDGVDIYERERLATEGITDIEALAHTDIVANMVNTRIPMERLIDWVDQAVLILHLDELNRDPNAPAIQLRKHGIRTASAFIDATRSESCEELRERMRGILEVEDLEPLALVLERELVMRHIEQWNTSPLGRPGQPPLAITVGSSTPEIEIRLEAIQPVGAPVA